MTLSGAVESSCYATFVAVWARSFGFGDSAQEVIKGSGRVRFLLG